MDPIPRHWLVTILLSLCCLFSQSIRRLMRAVDLEVAALAMEVVFNVCIPSSSISSNLNDDWIDSVEVCCTSLHVCCIA